MSALCFPYCDDQTFQSRVVISNKIPLCYYLARAAIATYEKYSVLALLRTKDLYLRAHE